MPAARIELSTIGYRELSRMDRLSDDVASVSLDFVDADHVLVTVSSKKLFKRLRSCPPDHQDRLVHAAILELPGGKLIKETDWYLHDRRRYLWPLGHGTFLLRRLNDLYVVDSSLHEQLLLSSPKDLLWVAVTPDASQIIVETATDGKRAPPGSPATPEPKFVAQFLDAKTLLPQRKVPLNKVVDLNGTSAGYVDLVRKGDIWLIRFGPSPTQRHNLARVRSRAVPSVVYASNNSLLIGRCPLRDCTYSVTSFTVTAHRLWRQHWSRSRYFPVVARTEDNSRFGVSTLQLAQVNSAEVKPGTAPDDPDDPLQLDVSQRDIFQQDIQIFETASGSPVFSLKVSPAIFSGQNFSLSPDGRRMAVLQGTSLDLYDLPPISSDEQAKFALLKADVPALYAVASTSSSPSELDAAAPGTNDAARVEALDSALNASAEKADDSNSTDDPNSTAGTEDGNRPPPAETEDSPRAITPTNLTGREVEAKAVPVTTFRASTRSVIVDVVVTDAKGHPVRGLSQQDFQLMEDGKPQNLGSFREFNDADTQPAASSTPPQPTRNVFTNDTHSAEPGAVTLVLFDMLNTPSQDQVYARQQLIKFLESKPKNGQFALCTLSGGATSLRLIQGFTQDETMLLAAARGNKGAPQQVRWQASASETRNSVSTVGDLAQGGRTSGFQNLLGAVQGMQAEQVGTDTDERVAITVDSLMALSRYLSGIPGRKNLVWLSGAFPVSIAAPMGANDSAADNRNYSQKLRSMTNLLAEAQVAVYPVDVRGLLGGGLSADSSGFMAAPARQLAPTSSAKILAPENSAAPQGLAEMDQQTAERNTLTQVASATGGEAFYNSNGIREAIATAAEQGSNYYTLSYSPTNKIYNGKFRKIKVSLAEKKYHLHYRQGYFAEDASSASRNADLARRARAAAMQHGSPASRQILFSATVAPVGTSKKMNHDQIGEVLPASTKKPVLPPVVKTQHYSIDYLLQGSQLQFTPQESSTYRSVLILMIASFDGEGTMLTALSHLAISNLEPAVYKDAIGGELRLHEEVDVPADAVSLRLGIQDQMSNLLGTIEIPLPVPPLPNAPRRIKHPLPEIEAD